MGTSSTPLPTRKSRAQIAGQQISEYAAKSITSFTATVASALKVKESSVTKLTANDIGTPMDFRHIQHVGWDPINGFNLDQETTDLQPFFKKADNAGANLSCIEEHSVAERVKILNASALSKVANSEHPERPPKAKSSEKLKTFCTANYGGIPLSTPTTSIVGQGAAPLQRSLSDKPVSSPKPKPRSRSFKPVVDSCRTHQQTTDNSANYYVHGRYQCKNFGGALPLAATQSVIPLEIEIQRVERHLHDLKAQYLHQQLLQKQSEMDEIKLKLDDMKMSK